MKPSGGFHMLDIPLDRVFPVVPAFILVYWFWYIYHVIIFWHAFAADDGEFYFRLTLCIFAGMFTFIIISAVFPNGQDLRPAELTSITATSISGIWEALKSTSYAGDPFAVLLVILYHGDTPTNIFPSIHVYDAIVLHAFYCRYYNIRSEFLQGKTSDDNEKSRIRKRFSRKKLLSLIICALIILSTLLLKQHTLIDLVGSFAMFAVFYPIFTSKKTAGFFRHIENKFA